ncbi:CocE/NonD family hydrolase [Cognaticolwellia mytili]|uniref:CocE/NonD family hydrolase n=1 Tax=Cognaticolwellia mytili TaxID=1888913 RepID=UPI000A172608|nr:CocE/NonD family hydrolase [Cognaticolwellia mytili]
MTLTQRGCKTIRQIRLIPLSLLILVPFFSQIQAKGFVELKPASATYSTPEILKTSKVENKQDVITLMQSTKLKQQLLAIANQIDYEAAIKTSDSNKIALSSLLGQSDKVLTLINKNNYPINFYHYSLFTKAQVEFQGQDEQVLKQKLAFFASKSLEGITGERLHKVSNTLGWSLPMGQDYMLGLFKSYKKHESLTVEQAINLLANYQLYKVYEHVLPIARPLVSAEQNSRYLVMSDVLIKTPDGATISAIVVRKKGNTKKRPTAFQFSIYADEEWEIKEAMHAASHGYIGVVANTRGKGRSTDEIIPWEYDGADATAVIDWISKQSWSDGRVAMYGGSYLGFTQWAAAKYMHPALKTIVPYEAANLMTGLPVENNIFITPNYQWAFHVTNNKTMDHSVYADWQHWKNTYNELFKSGRAFKDIDKIEGTPNPWFQKWLSHPSYDDYYQSMVPYEHDYKKINIPVLTITGYFGASISAIDFLTNHVKFNENADHTLLIGPYGHGTAQGIPRSHHSNYQLDEVALEKDTKEITFAWFDHVLFKKAKPKLLKDRVNYQLMGSNTWQHKASLSALNQAFVTYHLGNKQNEDKHYQLTTNKQNASDFIKLTVDMSDRKNQHNEYSWQVIKQKLQEPNGLIFTTKPFDKAQELAGAITGNFSLAINKKDVDIGFKFYELKPNGETFKLARYISRASYANDMSKRALLTPNKKTTVPIINSTVTAKLIGKGSRLVIVLNVNKNSGAQVNMGTGKDVSEETVADAGVPLEVKWFSDSQINIPLKPWHG